MNVLLTGITGFLGSHTAIQLLEKGYSVTGTLRDKTQKETILDIISRHTKNVTNLTLVEADLTDKNIWPHLTEGVDYVQHIASPFPRRLPKNDDDLIIPAKEGTLNVLRAASKNKVKRVVMTSSIAAIVYGKKRNERSRIFNENDWTDESNVRDSTPYFRSKTIAERAAWDFIRHDKSGLELTTILPGAILGPILEKDFGTSANLVIKILDGSSPALPKIGFDIVDVRSVADLLIKAMEFPQAAHQRYIGSAGYLTFKQIATIISAQYPYRKIPASELPNFLLKLIAIFDGSLKPILPDAGVERKVDITKATNALGWKPLSVTEAVLSCAQSVFAIGLVK